MLEHSIWQELAAAYVKLQARVLGWSVVKIRKAKTSRSLYVDLACGSLRATVRLSDHRPSIKAGERRSMFSVRQAACARLADLRAFLLQRATVSD